MFRVCSLLQHLRDGVLVVCGEHDPHLAVLPLFHFVQDDPHHVTVRIRGRVIVRVDRILGLVFFRLPPFLKLELVHSLHA